MPVEITMPQLSDTMTEGTVVKWLKKEGDKVKAGEVIAEVETDKATMAMEAFEGGTLAHIAAQEGAKVAVGQPIAILATGKEKVEDVKKQAGGAAGGKSAKQPAPAAKEPVGAAAGGGSRPKERGAAVGANEAGGALSFRDASVGEMHEPDEVHAHGATREDLDTAPPQGGGGNGDGRVRVSPLARRIAEEKGIDLGQIQGSGPGGRIVKSDVLAAAERGGAAAAKAPAAAEGAKPQAASAPSAALPQRVARGQKEVIPLTKMRTVIAQRLQQSKQQIPHFYETVDVDVESLSQLREKLNKQLEREKVKLSVSDFVNKAIAAALMQHPNVNAHFNAGKNEITRFGDVNLGIAVALPEGLIVPVLRNIDQMGLKEIRQRSVELAEKARAGRLKQDELSGATFTVSTLGMYGIREFAAIINPPEVGILAVGAAEPRAVVREGQVVARTMMTVTLSVDHRAVDGASAADFLRTLKGLLEEPAMMLV